MKFEVATLSETGPRASNEDAIGVWRITQDRLAIAIADGLGGLAGGQIASHMAIDTFGECVLHDPHPDLRAIANRIHTEIRTFQGSDSRYVAMATTLSAAVFQKDRMHCVHAGDSRIVIARGSGIKRLTTDHTEAQKLYTAGKLSREQLVEYPRAHILDSALGIHGEPRIDTFEFNVEPGDRFLFSTDGVHRKILLRELLYFADQSPRPEIMVDLIKSELEIRKPEDNYSLVAVFVS